MMRYKVRRTWRHFKYNLLEVFFGKQDLKKFLDIDRLDIEDAVNFKGLNVTVELSDKEYEYFTRGKDAKYGLQYELARRMSEILAKHIEVSEMKDLDTQSHIVMGSIVLAERKE